MNTTEERKIAEELRRLSSAMPLFKWHIGHIVLDKNSVQHYNSIASLRSLEPALRQQHREKYMSRALHSMYPSLKFGAFEDQYRAIILVWTTFNETSVGQFSILDPDLHNKLSVFHDAVRKIEKHPDDLFFCTGHMRVEVIKDYHYFHFTGKYCQQYGEEHPEHRKMAGRENYD